MVFSALQIEAVVVAGVAVTVDLAPVTVRRVLLLQPPHEEDSQHFRLDVIEVVEAALEVLAEVVGRLERVLRVLSKTNTRTSCQSIALDNMYGTCTLHD